LQKRIAILDDDQDILNLFYSVLSPEYSVYITNSSSDFIDYIDKNGLDLLIIDLLMPDIDGFDIISHLRKSNDLTPVIIVSGINKADSRIESIHHAKICLQKPVDPEELLIAVENTVGVKI